MHPTITLLPPTVGLTKAHHYIPGRKSSYVPSIPYLTSSAKSLPLARPGPVLYFQNPWPSYRSASFSDLYTAYMRGAEIALPRQLNKELKELLPQSVLEAGPDERYRDDEDEQRAEDDEDDWREPPVDVKETDGRIWDEPSETEAVTWLGHAGVLLQVPWRKSKGQQGMCNVLFDPIFSYRCSPTQWLGPARYVSAPCKVSQLPAIHLLFISHDHYDHLDYETIKQVWQHHHTTVHFILPLGLKKWFLSCKIPEDRITELDWWDEAVVSFSASTFEPYRDQRSSLQEPGATDEPGLVLKIACTPAQHRSGRGIFDHMTTLWASWVLAVVGEDERDARALTERGVVGLNGFRCYFGGDTGYRYATAPDEEDEAVCPAFNQIAKHYSPFSLSMLPLSPGSSLPYLRQMLSLSLHQHTLTSSQHLSPQDALALHTLLGSKRSLGIHWGTFNPEEESRGTRVAFGRERRRARVSGQWTGRAPQSVDNGRFVISDVGERLVVPVEA